MTSTSVGGLNSLMTFVNGTSSKTQSSKSDGADFESLMAKAGGNQTKTDIGSADSGAGKKSDAEAFASKVNTLNSKSSAVQERVVTKTVTKTTGSDDENDFRFQMDKAEKDIVANIADELNVEKEDVLNAMETLGITAFSLTDQSNIGKLVLEINGESDPMTLVTDENVFNSVKNLTSIVDATLGDLASDMDMDVSELSDFASQLKEFDEQSGSVTEMSVNADSEQTTDMVEDTPKFTVTVENNGKTAEVETDERGNEIKTVSVENVETKVTDLTGTSEEKSSTSSEEGSDSKDNRSTLGFIQEITNTDNSISESSDVSETNETQSFVSTNTNEIMDQILEQVKVNYKPDMQEIELSLHPASLGNVKVNLTNKGGEVTAVFKVQNENVKAAVEAQIQELRETFKDQGTKVTAIEVSVDTQGFDSNLWQGKGNEQSDGGEASKRRTRRIDVNSILNGTDEVTTEEDELTAKMMEVNGNQVDYLA